MKKIALSVFAFSILLCGCFFEDSSKKSYKENIINVNNTGTYSVPQEFWQKDAYLVCYNDSGITKNSSVDSYSCNESGYSAQSTTETSLRSATFTENEDKTKSFLSRPKRIDYIQEPFDIKLTLASEARTVSSSSPDYTGDTAKFYLDYAYNYKQVTATIKNEGNYCRVWYYGDSSIETPSNSIFEDLTVCFDKIFKKETELLCSNVPTQNYTNIISVSKSTKINILVYDIFDDYEETVKNNGGTYGFFNINDMYSENIKYNEKEIPSNKCEMFYIDTYFLTEKDSKENKVLSQTMISTLAHEFQHMLGFIQKGLNYKLKKGIGETWYTEMLSMLTEEFFVEYLGIDELSGPQGRIPNYLSGNRYGFSNWRNSESVVYNNYANAYAFGAYLTRNFGGIELVQRIFRNRYTDEESIVCAVKASGYDYDFSELLALFSAVQIYTSDSSHISLYKSGEKDIFSYPEIDLRKFYSILLPKEKEDELNYLMNGIYSAPGINEKTTLKANDDAEYFAYKGPIYYKQNPFMGNIDYTGSYIVHLGKINEFTIDNNSRLKYYILFK